MYKDELKDAIDNFEDHDIESKESEYYYDKIQKKIKVVRKEFFKAGYFEMPLIKKQAIDINKIEPWNYTKTKKNDDENKHKSIHFFTYDWKYESVYSNPEAALEKLDQYYALFTPDFSLYTDMPLALQISNTFKNRWCGAYWQKNGMKVIPTIEWGDKRSFDFCFDGVEKGSVVAVSTYGREKCESGYMTGYNKMLEVIKPSTIICYGDPFSAMKGNIKAVSPFNEGELIKQLGITEYLKRRVEGSLYPSN